MVQVIEQSDQFGKIGKSFGEGLGSQIPKEMDRYRLSKGLENFEKNSAGKTPFQQAADFYKIPGATAEMGYTLFPLLKQQGQRDEANRMANEPINKPGQPQGQPNISPLQINQPAASPKTGEPFAEETVAAGMKKGLKSLETSRAQLTPFEALSQDQRMQRAAQLSNQNPLTYPTPQDALARVNADEDIREKNFREHQNIGNVADVQQDRLRTGLEKHWGKESTDNIPGTVQTKLLQNIEDDLVDPNNKLSESQLIQKWGNVGKNLAMADANLSKVGLVQRWTDPKQKIKDSIDRARNAWKEVGALEEFSDNLSADFNLSPDLSARMSFDRRPELQKVMKKWPKLNSLKISEGQLEQAQNAPIKFAQEIAPLLTSEDSLLGLSNSVRQLGYDPTPFLHELKRLSDRKKIPESKFHDREFQKGVPAIRSLYDIYFSDMAEIE